MSLLLDTHVLIWLYHDPGKISSRVRDAVGQGGRIVVSVVSGWEYELKRLRRERSVMVSFSELIAGSGFETQGLPFECHAYAQSLPPVHADPFDRMLIAHALVSGAKLVTSDEAIHRYPVETLW